MTRRVPPLLTAAVLLLAGCAAGEYRTDPPVRAPTTSTVPPDEDSTWGVDGPTATSPAPEAAPATTAVTDDTALGTSAPLAPTGGSVPTGHRSAVDVLAGLRVEAERRDGYDRDLFDHWIDADGDGCTTRHEVLRRDALGPVQLDVYRCFVVAGDWYSPYDGVTHTDPADLDVDHVVALAEAWASGAWAWDPATRRAFANDLDDPRTLRAVTDAVNAAKRDFDIAEWLPSNPAYRCTYVADWLAIKARWDLRVDGDEHRAIDALLRGECAGTSVAPWPPATVHTTTTMPAGSTADTTGSAVDGDVHYENCAAARAAGAAPLLRGDAGYRPQLDRDGDGVACE